LSKKIVIMLHIFRSWGGYALGTYDREFMARTAAVRMERHL
jgi:hypothetical protein